MLAIRAGNIGGPEQGGERLALLRIHQDRERVAEALINLSHGAAALGLVVRMEMAASYALTIATRRSEAQPQMAAEELLAASRYTQPQENEMYHADDHPLAPASDWLAGELVEALTEVST